MINMSFETLLLGILRFIQIILLILMTCTGLFLIYGSICEVYEDRNYKGAILCLIGSFIMFLPFIYMLGGL